VANFEYNYFVCDCKKVSLGEIVSAIKNNSANSIEDIKRLTDAGTACGCCVCPKDDFGEVKMKLYLEHILKKFEQNV
jgi:NAD(P)H-nitrite reductase large subunit